MKKVVLYSILFLLTLGSVSAQKIKYKELFPILESKNYSEGEPKLRAFLANPKNAEHPNANLQMVLLLKDKIKPLEIINDSSKIIKYCDSIQVFALRTKKLITDREVKKKDQYYKAYYKRDLRTGSFGIKSSHIHSDLDDILKYHKVISEGTSFLAVTLPELAKSQAESSELYTKILEGYDSETSLALALNEEIKNQLIELKAKDENTREIVASIQGKVATLPEIGFISDEELKAIENFATDGIENKDVYQGSFEIWEFNKFVDRIIQTSEGKMSTFHQSLLDENKKLDQVNKKIARAEISAVRPFISTSLLKQSSSIDPNNLVINILKFKKIEATFNLLSLKDEDVSHVYLQLVKYDSLNQMINKANEFLEKIIEKNTKLEKLKYSSFIRTVYNRESQLDKYIDVKKIWVKNRKALVSNQVEELNEAVKWGVNQNDSIAVFLENQNNLMKNFTTYIAEDSAYFKIIGGFELTNSPLVAFIGRVDPSMSLIWKHTFKTNISLQDSLQDKTYFKLLPGFEEYTTVHYTSDEKNYHFIAFNKSSGDVEWEVSTKVKTPIFEVKYNELTKEMVLFLNDPDNLPEGDEIKYMVIDKSGNIRK